jgi:hypothetical protein
MERKLLTKKDALLVILVVLAAAAVLLIRRYAPAEQYPVAVVTVGSEEVMRIDLADAQDGIVELGEPDVRLKMRTIKFVFTRQAAPTKSVRTPAGSRRPAIRRSVCRTARR